MSFASLRGERPTRAKIRRGLLAAGRFDSGRSGGRRAACGCWRTMQAHPPQAMRRRATAISACSPVDHGLVPGGLRPAPRRPRVGQHLTGALTTTAQELEGSWRRSAPLPTAPGQSRRLESCTPLALQRAQTNFTDAAFDRFPSFRNLAQHSWQSPIIRRGAFS